MSEKNLLIKCSIHYYANLKFYQTMLYTSIEATRIFPNELMFNFYHAISLSLDKHPQESNRELEILQEIPDFQIASNLVLINNLKQISNNNKEEISSIESKIRLIRKTFSDRALFNAAIFLFLNERFDKCKEYLDRALKLSNSQNNEYFSLKGWLELKTAKDENNLNDALKYFKVVSKQLDPYCLIGKAKTLAKLRSFDKAIECLNELIQLYPTFIPGYIEKIKVNIKLNNWEQALELSTKTLTLDRHCIDSYCFIILYNLVWNFNEQQVCLKLNDLNYSLETRESKNSKIYYDTAKLFSRYAFGNKEILVKTFSLIEKAVLIDNTSINYLCELGHQAYKLDRIKDAERYLKDASDLDENNLNLLFELTLVAIKKNEKSFIKKILSLENSYKLSDMPIILIHMIIRCKIYENSVFESIIPLINEIIIKHTSKLKKLNFGFKYYCELDLDLILYITKIYLDNSCYEPIIMNDNQITSISLNSSFLDKIENYLQLALISCPGSFKLIEYVARIKYLKGDFMKSILLIDQLIDKNLIENDLLLLKAKILVSQKKTSQATQVLETAISHDFQIRDNHEFILIKSKILKNENKIEESIKLVEDLLIEKKSKLTDYYFINCNLVLIELYLNKNQHDKATELIEELMKKFKGTKYEKKILIENSTIQESLGNIEEAILIIKKINFNNNLTEMSDKFNEEFDFYIKTKEKLANIYLKYEKNNKLYIECYQNILEINKTVESYILLGNAYLNILETEKSIETYEKALRINPKDANLMRKVGQLYIKIHLYEKAITYYKAAIKTSNYNDLKFDLAELYYKIKKYDEAIDTINNSIELLKNTNNQLENFEFESKINYLLFKIQLDTGKTEKAVSSLQKSYSAQKKVIRRLITENSESLIHNKQIAIKICIKLAEQVNFFHQNSNQSVIYLKEALNYDFNNTKVLLKLAEVELNNNNYEEVQSYCRTILQNNPNEDNALLILAKIMFFKNQFENSIDLLDKALIKKPDNIMALYKLIEASRRTGKLVDIIPKYIEKAELKINEPTKLAYCKGIFHFYLGSIDEAINYLMISRNDIDFGLSSKIKIIEILINPENEIVGSEMFHDLINDTEEDKLSAKELSMKIAEKFLKDLQKNQLNENEFLILKSLLIYSYKSKNEIEQQINILIKKLNENQNTSLYLNYGIAAGYMVLKQYSKAKSILKSLNNLNWEYLDAEYFEKNWLLLADIYIQNNKFELATDLLKKCLIHNKSCIKANELLGLINQKEQSFDDAIKYFTQAWYLTNNKNLRIGYRLALCYMKSQKFVESINVCDLLLQLQPEFIKVKNEILDKCKLYLI